MRYRDEDAPRLPDPRMIPVAQPQSWFDSGAYAESEQLEAPVPTEAEDDDDGVFVRPFIVTRGRTRPLHDGLRIETLIRALPAALSAPLQFEQRQIVELAQRPVSLAEVAARLGVPLGVARVLIADLYTGKYISLHEPTELPVHVIERIRDLVRAL
ncbi:MAG TPA: DUF742 domain-containing protein [Pseudonocardiaceae bacterium]|nr:DUF742 domain-containing protein [Pseudonocardiaceae bacterium]